MIHLLHISDLHLVTDPQWNNMKNAILYSVREKLKSISRGQKLLVITGDFHNFVQNDYTQAEAFLPQLFEAMDIEPDKDVFVIPGNHDITTPDFQKDDRDLVIQAVKSKPTMLQKGLDKLLSCYDNYIAFVQKLNIYPPDCGRLPVHVHVRSWRNRLNILHLNTTLAADGVTKKNQMADTLAATSDHIRSQLNLDSLPRIAIGHNSYFDLLREHQTLLSAMFLQEYISAYLCGDKHQRNSVREENRIVLGNALSTVTIPNIVSYKSSTDEGDTYSDFGMIWHIWDEKTGHVDLEFMKWDPADQAELQPDGRDCYNFRKLHQTIPSIAATNTDYSCWFSNHAILAKSRRELKDFHVRSFLRGSQCEWNLAFSDRIVMREIVDTLYGYAMDGGIYALLGPGGEGKTTILMQLCAKLVSDEIPVFYYRGHGTLKLPDDIPDKAVFIMDNPPYSRTFKHFLDNVIEDGRTLIIGGRQNEWNLLKTSLSIPDRIVFEIPLQKLTTEECGHFTECVITNLNCSKSRTDIKELFQNNSYGFLYAAMLMVVNNENSLEEIAVKIINNLYDHSPKALLLLAHIVFSERYEVRFLYMQFRKICAELKISPKEASRALSREISLNSDIYQTRHIVISKLFYKELFSDSGLLSIDDIDSILEHLMLFYLQKYQSSYGSMKAAAWNSVMQLADGLSQAGLETQKYLINRILDEVNSERPKTFHQLPSCINSEETRLLFYKECFAREYISLNFLLEWCSLLQKNGASWTVDEPYSPAWIMRNACVNHNADSNTWLAWAQMEAQQNQAGDYSIENTARWIFREACINYGAGSQTWRAWAQLEAHENHVGDYSTENTARWILREACLKHNAIEHVWLAWAQLEAHENHVGDYSTENTARWIFREACLCHDADSSAWLAWAQLEVQQSQVGSYFIENTARWIFREACLNHHAESSVWLAWAQLEVQQNKAGSYSIEYTARWIFREACLNYHAESSVWLAWAQLEIQENQIGDYQSENTARWIFLNACLGHNARSDVWLAWAQMEIQQNQAGSYSTENTARWIFRQACLYYHADSSVWLAWAQLEVQEGCAGDSAAENTARWIFSEGLKRFPKAALLYSSYACLELSMHSVEKSRKLLRQSVQTGNFSIGQLAILEFFCGNINSDDIFCMNNLMKRMEEKISYSSYLLLYLYHCCILLERTTDIEKYHKQLLERPDYDPSKTFVEDFIKLCREALT